MISNDGGIAGAKVLIEYLRHINSVNIAVELPYDRNEKTRIDLSEDRTSLILSQGPAKLPYRLPVSLQVSHSKLDFSHCLPEPGQRSKAVKCPAAPQPTGFEDVLENQIAPWPASSLNAKSQILCGTCDKVLVDRQKVSTWKDLPSEGWAEMMDLWHCHKPNEHENCESGEYAGANKGYAASNRLVARPGVGLVNDTSFLISEEDCVVYKRDELVGDTALAICPSCNTIVGRQDSQTQGIRLYKHFVNVVSSNTIRKNHVKHHRKWLSSFILSNIEASGSRRYYCQESKLEIWVFSQLETISGTCCSMGGPHMKILYRGLNGTFDGVRLTPDLAHLEELTLPTLWNKDSLNDVLDAAHSQLPTGVNTFQDWKVAFLPRFDAEDFRVAG